MEEEFRKLVASLDLAAFSQWARQQGDEVLGVRPSVAVARWVSKEYLGGATVTCWFKERVWSLGAYDSSAPRVNPPAWVFALDDLYPSSADAGDLLFILSPEEVSGQMAHWICERLLVAQTLQQGSPGGLALIDIDGILADSSRRENECREIRETARGQLYYVPGSLDWDKFLDGELADRLDEVKWRSAPRRLEVLRRAGWRICFCSSRPERMREGTQRWLDRHGLRADEEIVLKPEEARFVRTAEWKPRRMIDLAAAAGVGDRVIALDDEHSILDRLPETWVRACSILAVPY
jgi:hypothetical protein